MLVVRIPASGAVLDDVELEFSPADAVLVRESAGKNLMFSRAYKPRWHCLR